MSNLFVHAFLHYKYATEAREGGKIPFAYRTEAYRD